MTNFHFTWTLFFSLFLLGACQDSLNNRAPTQTLLLSHTKDGRVISGSRENIIQAVRQGCDLRVGWGSRRPVDPSRTIEHIATPNWVSVRDGTSVEVQIGNFLINLPALGEPEDEHPRRQEYGGTTHVVKWEARLKTDGTFDAVWFYPHSGEFIKRVPQRYPMRWYSPCNLQTTTPLFEEFP